MSLPVVPSSHVWSALAGAGLVTGEPPALRVQPPWFVRVLLGFGGWMGALFLISFVGIGFVFIMESAPAALLAGALVCVGAAFAFVAADNRDSQFLASFAFAFSLAGQGLMTWGFARLLEPDAGSIAAAVALQQAVLFVAMRNSLHRVWTAGTCAIALLVMLADWKLASLAVPLLSAPLAWIWLREFEAARWAAAWRSAGYGIAGATLLAAYSDRSFMLFALLGGPAGGTFVDITRWTALALGAAVLGGATFALLRREGVPLGSPAGRSALLITALLALASLKAPGITPALLLLVLGFANGNRLLAGLGTAALVGYLSHYYYSLQATLLEKSALLAATGAALLLARLVLGRTWAHSPEASDA